MVYELNRLEVGNVWTSVSLTQTETLLSVVAFLSHLLLCLSFLFYCRVSQYPLCTHTQTHMHFGLFVPYRANKTLNPALKLISGLWLCVATVSGGNPVKSVMLIIITKTPWRPEDAIHHSPSSSIFPAGLFPPTGQFQIGGYGSVEL